MMCQEVSLPSEVVSFITVFEVSRGMLFVMYGSMFSLLFFSIVLTNVERSEMGMYEVWNW